MTENPSYNDLLQRVRQLEAEMASSQHQQLRSFFDSSPMGVHMYELQSDNSLIFIGFNQSANKLLGVDHAAFVGKTIEQAFPSLQSTQIPDIYREIAQKGTTWTTEQVVYDDGNISGAFEVHAFQISPFKMAVLFLEISERKRAEQKLIVSEKLLRQQNEEYQALNEEYLTQNEELNSSFVEIQAINAELETARAKAEESDKLKSAFLANMSHEIRTPMNGIVGFAELLKNTELKTEKAEKYIDIINDNCHQLLNIINDIIDISKIEAGLVVIKPEAFNINKMLADIYNLYLPMTLKKNIILNITKGLPDNNAQIISDPARLRQVIINIMSNAFKFTSQGSILLEYKVKNNKLEFSISDTGIGIESNCLELIFERFRQVDNSNSRNFGGTGLGLSISKSLVGLLGGQIWVESEFGKGAKFTFNIAYTPETTISNNLPETTLIKHYDWSGKTILIAEDEETNLFFINELVGNKGAQILNACNGLEAVACVSNQKVDIVLMDLKMPEMNGFEATRVIKQKFPNLPIIAQTAYAMSNDREKAIAAGCSDYISKPLDRANLFYKIDFYLSNYQI
jgi:PAS domain S-box-containing protein